MIERRRRSIDPEKSRVLNMHLPAIKREIELLRESGADVPQNIQDACIAYVESGGMTPFPDLETPTDESKEAGAFEYFLEQLHMRARRVAEGVYGRAVVVEQDLFEEQTLDFWVKNKSTIEALADELEKIERVRATVYALLAGALDPPRERTLGKDIVRNFPPPKALQILFELNRLYGLLHGEDAVLFVTDTIIDVNPDGEYPIDTGE